MIAGNVTDNGSLIFDNPGSTSFAGVIGGGGTVEVSMGQTVTLTATNTYSGATMIDSAATLQVGNGGSTGSISGTSAVTDNGTLAFDVSGPVSLGAPISGTGGVSVSTGTVTLSGANSYSGPTTVYAGVLQAGSTSAFG